MTGSRISHSHDPSRFTTQQIFTGVLAHMLRRFLENAPYLPMQNTAALVIAHDRKVQTHRHARLQNRSEFRIGDLPHRRHHQLTMDPPPPGKP